MKNDFPDEKTLLQIQADWQERYSRPLTRHEAFEIACNLLEYFKILQAWSETNQTQNTNQEKTNEP